MVSKKDLFYFFAREKPVNILINLSRDDKLRYASALSKEANCTYSHTVKILNLMKKYGIVEFNKKGRLKTVKLTQKGKELSDLFRRMKILLGKL